MSMIKLGHNGGLAATRLAWTVDALLDDMLGLTGMAEGTASGEVGRRSGAELRYARGIGLDADGVGDPERDDIRLVDTDKAKVLFRQDFLFAPRLHILPEALQPVLFDWAIHVGPPRVIMALQSVLTACGFPCGSGDGVIGPKTRLATEAAARAMGDLLIEAMVEERNASYRQVVRDDPGKRALLADWLARSERLRPTAGSDARVLRGGEGQ